MIFQMYESVTKIKSVSIYPASWFGVQHYRFLFRESRLEFSPNFIFIMRFPWVSSIQMLTLLIPNLPCHSIYEVHKAIN
jgi:hypothetical protein